MLDKASVALTKIICGRLMESRSLCNLTRVQAAELMCISNESLAMYEGSTALYAYLHIPLWFLPVAANTYDVSLDYLFGLTDDFDSHHGGDKSDRKILTTLNLLYLSDARDNKRILAKYDNRLKTLESVVTLLPVYLRRIIDSFKRFRALNADFDDMQGSNTLLVACDDAEKIAHQATLKMVRYRCIPKENLYQIE